MDNWDICLRGLPGIGLIVPGDDLATIIVGVAKADGLTLADGDVVVVAQKVVSKAEGRIVNLADFTPGERALILADRTGRDPRWAEAMLSETRAILNVKGRHIVTVDKRGFQGTGSGVDMSNVGPRSEGRAVFLPVDPDASARRIRDSIREQTGFTIAVIISDSFGSDNRDGAYGAAIGIAGIRHLEELPGEQDLFGNQTAPMMNRVDEIASAASIIMGQTDAGRPVVIGRGLPYTVDEDASISRLLVGPPLPDVDFDLRPGF